MILLTGSEVINYNPCDHWMSPLFLKCSTDTDCLAVLKPADLTKSRVGKDRGSDDSHSNQIPNTHRHTHAPACAGAHRRAGEKNITQAGRENTLWIQFPPSSLGVYPILNNATLSEAGWQILRGTQESRITSEEMVQEAWIRAWCAAGQMRETLVS